MLAAHGVENELEIVEELIEAIDVAAWALRAAVSAVIVGVHNAAPPSEPGGHLFVAAAVLGVAVDQEQHARRALGSPRAPEEAQPVVGAEVRLVPAQRTSRRLGQDAISRRSRCTGRLDPVQVGHTPDVRAPEVGRDPVFLAQATDVVGKDHAAGLDIGLDRRRISGHAHGADHVRHDLHQPQRALRAARPRAGGALDLDHRGDEQRIERILDAVAEDRFADARDLRLGEMGVQLVEPLRDLDRHVRSFGPHRGQAETALRSPAAQETRSEQCQNDYSCTGHSSSPPELGSLGSCPVRVHPSGQAWQLESCSAWSSEPPYRIGWPASLEAPSGTVLLPRHT